MDIHGKVVVVTGGGSGIGAETARYFSQKGGWVAIVDKDIDAANNVANDIDGLPVYCDVANEAEATSAFDQIEKELGLPQIMINCAGIAPAQRVVGREGPMPFSDFDNVIRVNLLGTFNMMRLAAYLMSRNEPCGDDHEQGVIINTASIAAYEGQIGQCAYSASKGGVCALTLPAARELAQFGIRVVTIAPGLIFTPLLQNLPTKAQESLANQIPFPPRLGKPFEFALLASQIVENPYINGEIIRLDGALRMGSK